MKKSTKLIYYHGGCYGTFFEWLYCHFLNPDNTVKNPFTSTGSSHNFIGNNWTISNYLMDYINSASEVQIGRCHPSIFDSVTVYKNIESNTYEVITRTDLDFLNNNFAKIVVIHPSNTTKFWLENNIIDKIKISKDEFDQGIVPLGVDPAEIQRYVSSDSNDRFRYQLDMYVPRANLAQWGKESVFDFDIWELRELLSYFYFSSLKDKYTCWDKIKDEFPNVKFISLDDLKFNFNNIIREYFDFFEVKNYKDSQIQQIYNDWLSKQIHISKDQLIDIILQCIHTGEFYDWSTEKISIIDEAFIQKSLRDKGYELRCFGLNVFPTNTKDFIQLLEKS